jgi:hypothetical protein
MKKAIKKKVVKKEKKVEYFTDEMAKEIFLFQDKMSRGSKPIISTISRPTYSK